MITIHDDNLKSIKTSKKARALVNELYNVLKKHRKSDYHALVSVDYGKGLISI